MYNIYILQSIYFVAYYCQCMAFTYYIVMYNIYILQSTYSLPFTYHVHLISELTDVPESREDLIKYKVLLRHTVDCKFLQRSQRKLLGFWFTVYYLICFCTKLSFHETVPAVNQNMGLRLRQNEKIPFLDALFYTDRDRKIYSKLFFPAWWMFYRAHTVCQN